MVGGFKRENLLNYKERDSDELNNNIYFKFFYDNSLPFLNKIIKKSWLEFTNKTNYNLYKTTNLYLTNSLQQNIKKTLYFIQNLQDKKSIQPIYVIILIDSN